MWEYKVHSDSAQHIIDTNELIKILDLYGKENWELVGITNYTHKYHEDAIGENIIVLIFKREKNDK